MSRRTFSVLAVGSALAACARATDGNGTAPGSSVNSDPVDVTTVPDLNATASVDVPEREQARAARANAGRSVTEFGLELFGLIVADVGATRNVSFSPLSVAAALALVEPGAVGDAQAQLRAVLRGNNPNIFRTDMNAIGQSLESRRPRSTSADEQPGEVMVRLANAAYVQRDYALNDGYLDVIGRNYGPALREVDFRGGPTTAADEINSFIAAATNDLITEAISADDIHPDTVLALVNALYFKASWSATFNIDRTSDETFTRLDGTPVSVPMMNGSSSRSARGDGWVGAVRGYVGNFSAQFVLPDDGRFDDVAAMLPAAFETLSQPNNNGAAFAMPRFDTRLNTSLTDPIKQQGLTAPFEPGGLIDIADDPKLEIDSIAHETVIAFDEEGTEAAAATVVMAVSVSEPIDLVPVTLDRPFYYRILDDVTDTTLFIGQVTDPTAG